MLTSYWIDFTRIVIGLIFIISAYGKIQDVSSFTDAITRFKFFPKQFSPALAYLFLSGEILVVFLMLVGGFFLLYGYLLSFLMYLAFSIALSSVVIRKIDTSCNCFGPSEKPVTPFHIVRAAGLMVLSTVSGAVLYLNKTNLVAPDLAEWVLMALAGGIFALIWIQLDEIAELFRKIPA
jgi:uncharacterized membrane protein YphA (DoxX/SURF4 family)